MFVVFYYHFLILLATKSTFTLLYKSWFFYYILYHKHRQNSIHIYKNGHLELDFEKYSNIYITLIDFEFKHIVFVRFSVP